MNYEQLNREYWGRVFDMCESYNKEHGTDIKPWQCVRHDNKQWPIEYHPPFELRHPDFPKEKFSFAIAILESKPVFVGDEIFTRATGKQFSWDEWHESQIRDWEHCWTWTKPQPKRTFTLNGVELPCPEMNGLNRVLINDEPFFFKNYEDAQYVSVSLIKILADGRDK